MSGCGGSHYPQSEQRTSRVSDREPFFSYGTLSPNVPADSDWLVTSWSPTCLFLSTEKLAEL
jgi:hypothetical protein